MRVLDVAGGCAPDAGHELARRGIGCHGSTSAPASSSWPRGAPPEGAVSTRAPRGARLSTPSSTPSIALARARSACPATPVTTRPSWRRWPTVRPGGRRRAHCRRSTPTSPCATTPCGRAPDSGVAHEVTEMHDERRRAGRRSTCGPGATCRGSCACWPRPRGWWSSASARSSREPTATTPADLRGASSSSLVARRPIGEAQASGRMGPAWPPSQAPGFVAPARPRRPAATVPPGPGVEVGLRPTTRAAYGPLLARARRRDVEVDVAGPGPTGAAHRADPLARRRSSGPEPGRRHRPGGPGSSARRRRPVPSRTSYPSTPGCRRRVVRLPASALVRAGRPATRGRVPQRVEAKCPRPGSRGGCRTRRSCPDWRTPAAPRTVVPARVSCGGPQGARRPRPARLRAWSRHARRAVSRRLHGAWFH